MANTELRLVSKALRERDLKPALDRGIKADWFHDDEAREIWNVMIEHWQQYGSVPTPIAVKDLMPGVTILKVDDAYDFLIDQFVDWRRRALTIELLQGAYEKIENEEDHEAALQALSGGLAKIEDVGVQASRDIDLTQTVDERIENYLALKNLEDGMRGMSTGFPTIDRATSGLQGGQLVTIIATPKAGKSTLMVKTAINVNNQKKSVLLISFEMSNPEQEARHDAMVAQISHTRLMQGTMTVQDERALRRHLEYTKKAAPFRLTADPTGTSTVSGIAAKIETYNPDVVFVDGVYLMIDEISGEQNTPQALTNITRNLKRLAQKRNIPVVISTQALAWKINKKKGISADSIGYSSSFFQDSDVILGLQFVDDEEDETERLLKVVASRNCPRVEATVLWDWSTGRFEEYEG